LSVGLFLLSLAVLIWNYEGGLQEGEKHKNKKATMVMMMMMMMM
jgi:hypothetical protein